MSELLICGNLLLLFRISETVFFSEIIDHVFFKKFKQIHKLFYNNQCGVHFMISKLLKIIVEEINSDVGCHS